MRHSERDKSLNTSEREQPLSKTGIQKAEDAAQKIKQELKKESITTIDLAISSPFLPAIETLKIISKVLDVSETLITEKLSPQFPRNLEGIQNILKRFTDYKVVLIIGHNPRISNLCTDLASQNQIRLDYAQPYLLDLNIVNTPEQKLQLDYEQTNHYIGRLSNIRFELLKFVPVVAGLAIVILQSIFNHNSPQTSNNFFFISNINAETTFVIGLIGFFMTFGITIYELRNSELYDAALNRAAMLENLLGLPGGIFMDRPKAEFEIFKKLKSQPNNKSGLALIINNVFELFTIKHDRGLGLVYGAALGGWTYIIVCSLVSIIQIQIPIVILLFIVMFAGFIVVWMFYQHDDKRPRKTKKYTNFVKNYQRQEQNQENYLEIE